MNDNKWVGVKARFGGWVLSGPIRRLLEKFVWGDCNGMVMDEIGKRVSGDLPVVLDVGAGSGYYTLQIARMLPSVTVISLDSSDDMLAQLIKRAESKGLSNRIQVISADATAFDIERGIVDVAFCGFVLHELPDPDATLSEMHESLKSGGSIVLLDFKEANGHHHEDAHGPYSADELRDSLDGLGFSDIKITIIKKMLLCTAKKL